MVLQLFFCDSLTSSCILVVVRRLGCRLELCCAGRAQMEEDRATTCMLSAWGGCTRGIMMSESKAKAVAHLFLRCLVEVVNL